MPKGVRFWSTQVWLDHERDWQRQLAEARERDAQRARVAAEDDRFNRRFDRIVAAAFGVVIVGPLLFFLVRWIL